MVNYYEEFGLNPDMSSEEISAALFKEKKKWIIRQNASDMEKRQKAEKKIALIEEAVLVFADKLKRDQYDLKILKNQKKGKPAQAQQQPAQQQPAQQPPQEYQGNVPQTIEQIEANARTFYELGEFGRTIDYCRQMLLDGKESAYLHNYLGLAYWENDNAQEAIRVFRNAISHYPQEPWFYANAAKVDIYSLGNYVEGGANIRKAMELDPENSYFAALEILCMFKNSQAEDAEAKINSYLASHPEDQEFKNNIAEVYITYSDSFLVECDNGGAYIPTQQACDNIKYYRKKACELMPGKRTQDVLNLILEREKKEFSKDNLKGIGALLILGLLFAGFLFPVWVICAGLLAYFSYKPKWLIEKMAYTGKRDVANTICYYLYVAASYIFRFFIGCVKFVFRIAASM